MEDISDRQLITAIVEFDDHAAITELYDRYWRVAWNAALSVTGNKHDAEDVAQDALLVALSHLRSFDRSRPFRPWLTRIAVNRALNHRRSLRRFRPWPTTEPGYEFDNRVLDDIEMDSALRQLPSKYRIVVVLHYLVGFTTPEIADLLKRPVGTVNSQLARARKQLKDLLKENHGQHREAADGGAEHGVCT